MPAQTIIDSAVPGQLRISVRESGAGLVGFVAFVALVCLALYLLMPAARAQPWPLLAANAAAVLWAGVALSAREEYFADGPAGSLTVRRMGLLGQREDLLRRDEIVGVRLAAGGPDNDRRVVELLGSGREVRLRLPRRVNSFSAGDQRSVGRLLADHLGVPLEER